MRPMNAEAIEEVRKIASELVFIKNRLGRLGAYKTMHAIDAATTAIGYELAEHIEALDHTAEKDAARRAARFG